jgi:gamma-glutamyltranspeptidase/glutathione hydrolase
VPTFIDVPRPLLRASRGVVACGHPAAVSTALDVFLSNGNALDAAITAAFTLAVLLPDACGLGGDALLTVQHPDGHLQAWNGSGAAPAALSGSIPSDGGGTAAVPGAVHAWEVAHTAAGSLPWSRLLEPAIGLAERGAPLSESLARAISRHRHRLEQGAEAWPLLEPSLTPGQLVAQPLLAALLKRLANEGSSALYTGPVAEQIAAAVQRDGGYLTPDDLARHETVERPPIEARYRGVRLAAQPPVSQAGLALGALRAVEQSHAQGEADQTHALIEAIGVAFEHRDQFSEPRTADEFLQIHLDIDLARAHKRTGPQLPSHTTTVVTADRNGMVVSMLISVYDEFGSAALVDHAGILLNDRMTGFSKDPESPNAPAPSRRPVHTLSPFVIDDGDHVFALATPGADGQVQVVSQLISAIVDRDQPINAALHLPRWRSANGQLHVESGFSPLIASELKQRGHDIVPADAGAGMFGAAVVAGVETRHGTLFAASDPRREAWAGGC